MEELAVHADMITAEVGLRSKLGDGLAVHLNPALEDDLLRRPAAGDPRLRQDLLQPFARSGRLVRPLYRSLHNLHYAATLPLSTLANRT